MDYRQLVDEILKRVALKMTDLKEDTSPINKRRILLLTEQHGTLCHQLLENTKLQDCCHMDCALLSEYACDLEEYEAVVIYQLSNSALSKLAGGILVSAFLSLASSAILMGKKVFIPKEEIELYRYEKTAPDAYYAMMCEKLKLLQDSGVIQSTECSEKKHNTIDKYVKIDKKVITEKDLRLITADGANRIRINCNAILTDLAKEYLNTRKMVVDREDIK